MNYKKILSGVMLTLCGLFVGVWIGARPQLAADLVVAADRQSAAARDALLNTSRANKYSVPQTWWNRLSGGVDRDRLYYEAEDGRVYAVHRLRVAGGVTYGDLVGDGVFVRLDP